jgi:hypothetical protein
MQLARFIEWYWPRLIAWGIEHDGLPAGDGFDRVKWLGPAEVSIDAGREMAQEREDVAHGLMTRHRHFGNRSLDWKGETDQGFDEDEYIITQAQERGKRLGVDPMILLARRGFDTKAVQQPDEKGEEKDKKRKDEEKE